MPCFLFRACWLKRLSLRRSCNNAWIDSDCGVSLALGRDGHWWSCPTDSAISAMSDHSLHIGSSLQPATNDDGSMSSLFAEHPEFCYPPG
eukprot:7395769-Lingulodinium_polyedra.AAC.1